MAFSQLASALPADDVVKAPGKLDSDPRVQLWARLQQLQHVLGESGAQDRAASKSRAVSRNHGRQDASRSSQTLIGGKVSKPRALPSQTHGVKCAIALETESSI